MGWVLGLCGLITIFLVWKISDSLYKQHYASLSAEIINGDTTARGVIIDNNITSVRIEGVESESPKIVIKSTDDIVIKDNYFTTP